MKKLYLFSLALAAFCSLSAGTFNVYTGPHFNYANVDLDSGSDFDGYAGGLTAGLGYNCPHFFTDVSFEGTWNASAMVDSISRRLGFSEYFVEWKVGPTFTAYDQRLIFAPYTGLGWDQFNNTRDPNGADMCFEYNKLFIPVGFYATWIFNVQSSLSLQFEWRPDVYSDLDISSIDLDNSCENAFRVQLPYEYIFTRCSGTSLSVVPFFDWAEYGKSRQTNAAGAVIEIPSLTRWYLGLRLILGYAF